MVDTLIKQESPFEAFSFSPFSDQGVDGHRLRLTHPSHHLLRKGSEEKKERRKW